MEAAAPKETENEMDNKIRCIHLKTYSSSEPLADGRKRYRRSFEKKALTALYFELAFKNHHAGAENWGTEITVKCIKLDTEDKQNIIYNQTFDVLVMPNEPQELLYDNILAGLENDLSVGIYAMEVSVREEPIATETFFINAIDEVTQKWNPYFSIENIRAFKETNHPEFGLSKVCLAEFDVDSTGQIQLELNLVNKVSNCAWLCELFCTVFTADGELKERNAFLQVIDQTRHQFPVSLHIGRQTTKYWQIGIYRVQITFMETIVAEGYIVMGDEDMEGDTTFEKNADELASANEIVKSTRPKIQFTPIIEPDINSTFPDTIDNTLAIRIAYGEELKRIVSYISNGLSVLIICDKILTKFLYNEICNLAHKEPVLDSANFDTEEFVHSIKQMSSGQILILRSFEVLTNLVFGSSILFETTDENKNLPPILAFSDPSIPIKQILKSRFDVPERIQEIPREIAINGKPYNPLPYLITQQEKDLFKDFNENEIYKQVSGLNVLQFRNAFKYLQSKHRSGTDSQEIYQTLRAFKQHSNNSDIDLPNTSFDDIGGYEEVKQYILTSLSLFQQAEDSIPKEQQRDAIPKGFIFEGPPGTGKTLLAKAIANKLNATIQMVSGPEIVEMWVGKSEENLRNIFATARRNAPSVILFDEFDSIARKRTSSNTGGAMSANSLMAQLLTELDGFRPVDGVLVIATTNRIQDIDPALMRPSRLRRVFIDLPDWEARKKVAAIHAKHYNIDAIAECTIQLCIKHYKSWQNSAVDMASRQISPDFYTDIGKEFSTLAKRLTIDKEKTALADEIFPFLKFIQDMEAGQKEGSQQAAVLKPIKKQLEKVTKKIGMVNANDNATILGTAPKTELQKDFEELYAILEGELANNFDFIAQYYFNFLLDLVAEFTEQWNNDQIGHLFKGAMLAHNLEGKLLSPKYFGEQIGLINAAREGKL